MVTVTVTNELRDVLQTITEEAIIRDANGRIIGRFTPGQLSDEEVYAIARDLFDFEEIRRRKIAEHGKGRTTAEVLERLQAMEKQT